MGTWGPGLFSDDEACDVRDEYRELIAEELEDGEAERQVLDQFTEEDGAIRPVVWLALADTQSRLGRLSQRVKERALSAISDGHDVAEWADAAPSDRRKRQAALLKLAVRLDGPQPAPRKVRREWKYRTMLDAGDVLSLKLGDGTVRLLRLVGVERDRYSDFPLVELLEYRGVEAPDLEVIERLVAVRIPFEASSREVRWTVVKNEKQQPDRARRGVPLLGGSSRVRGWTRRRLITKRVGPCGYGSGFTGLGGLEEGFGRGTVNGFPFTYWESLGREIEQFEATGSFAAPAQLDQARPGAS